jgi:protein-tyrosine phosphatase
MVARPYWINSQMSIIPRPLGNEWLEDEMVALRDAGIDVIVSMLEGDEAGKLGLDQEGPAAARAGLIFINRPIKDRGVPADKQIFEEFLIELEKHLASGRRLGVHCRASIGRSSVTTASLLIRSGIASEDAWTQIAVARDCEVPDTEEQRAWVDQHVRPKA